MESMTVTIAELETLITGATVATMVEVVVEPSVVQVVVEIGATVAGRVVTPSVQVVVEVWTGATTAVEEEEELTEVGSTMITAEL